MLLGTTLLYRLSAKDVADISRRRTNGESIQSRMSQNPPTWPMGAQAHMGDVPVEGELLPLVVTKVNDDETLVGGQVFLNGNDALWVVAVPLVLDGPAKPGQAVTATDQTRDEALEATTRGRSRPVKG